MNKGNQLRKIGLDPGFSTIKLAEVQNGAVRTFVMPSTVGLGAATESAVGLAGVVKLPSRGRRPHHVIVEGEEYLVGPGVSDFSRPIHRMDFDRFTDSPELRASLYAALACVLDNGSCWLALAIGCRSRCCRTAVKPSGWNAACGTGWWATTLSSWTACRSGSR